MFWYASLVLLCVVPSQPLNCIVLVVMMLSCCSVVYIFLGPVLKSQLVDVVLSCYGLRLNSAREPHLCSQHVLAASSRGPALLIVLATAGWFLRSALTIFFLVSICHQFSFVVGCNKLNEMDAGVHGIVSTVQA